MNQAATPSEPSRVHAQLRVIPRSEHGISRVTLAQNLESDVSTQTDIVCPVGVRESSLAQELAHRVSSTYQLSLAAHPGGTLTSFPRSIDCINVTLRNPVHRYAQKEDTASTAEDSTNIVVICPGPKADLPVESARPPSLAGAFK